MKNLIVEDNWTAGPKKGVPKEVTNDKVAKKTRETIALHNELEGKEVMPVEEIKVDPDAD